jgi:hypothetical protein
MEIIAINNDFNVEKTLIEKITKNNFSLKWELKKTGTIGIIHLSNFKFSKKNT